MTRARYRPMKRAEPQRTQRDTIMNSIIYLVGLVVVVLAIMSFVGLR